MATYTKLPELPNSSEEEFRKLTTFSKLLIFKNEPKAEENESLDSSKSFYELINALLKLFPYDNEDPETVIKRNGIIENYKELNSYYTEFLQKIKILDSNGNLLVTQTKLIETLIKARTSLNNDIIYSEPNILNKKISKLFLQHYKENLFYYNSVLYNEGFSKYEKYWNNKLTLFFIK